MSFSDIVSKWVWDVQKAPVIYASLSLREFHRAGPKSPFGSADLVGRWGRLDMENLNGRARRNPGYGQVERPFIFQNHTTTGGNENGR